MKMNLFAKMMVLLFAFASLSGCTRNIANFSKGLAGKYCEETVYVYDDNTDSYNETCTEVVED